MDSKIAFCYSRPPEYVTGGQIYEHKFFTAINDCPDITAEYVIAPSRKNIFHKIIAPIRNLSMASKLSEYDIVIFNSTKFMYFLPLAFLLKARNVQRLVIHHHFLYHELRGVKRVLYRFLEKLFLKVNTPLTPSPYTADQIQKEVKRTPLICLIPFDHPAYDSLPTIPGKLLYVGTIENRKGLHFLFKALTQLQKRGVPYSLEIIGKTKDLEYKDQLEAYAAENNLNIHFNGYLSDEELLNMYRSADIFVFPSQLEGFGMALNEAMAFGLPVVTFNNSAMPYSVTDGKNGYLVNTGDSDTMAKRIEDIITDRNLRKSLSEGAKSHADSLPDIHAFGETARRIIRSLAHHT